MAAETETTALPESLPELATVDEAVALMTEVEETEREPVPEPNVEGAVGKETEVEPQAVEPEVADADCAPEFWSAEDKAAWQQVPETLRPVITKYEEQRIAFVNETTHEAAQAREEAMRVAQGATGIVEQAAVWWQKNGPAFKKAFTDRWSQVDWKAVAEKNPEEVARLITQRQEEEALLAEASRRGEADIAAANERADRAFLEAKRAEQAKLAAKLPDYFGPDVAAKTYDELRRFLFAKGIPADRIAAIHEAPIIELALAAMRFEQAQQLALRTRQASDAGNTANTTPTRVAPGPAVRAGHRQTEAARQVGERFRKSGGASISDAAELIRLNDL